LHYKRIKQSKQKAKKNKNSLSENGPESTPVPMLFLLEREYPRLSENLFSLGQKASRVSENYPDSMSKFRLSNSLSVELNMQKNRTHIWFFNLVHYFNVTNHVQITHILHNNISTYEIVYYPQNFSTYPISFNSQNLIFNASQY